MAFRILVADPIAQEGIDLLKTQAEVDVKLRLPREQLLAAIPQYDALVVRSETKVTAEVIEAGTRLQVIGRAGVGVDNIDVEAATKKGVVVVNAPAGNIISAAEHTIAMMFALARHIPQADHSLRGGRWERQSFMGIELRNKTLGIIGLGNVGGEVAQRAKGLQMNLLAHDPFVSPEYAKGLGIRMVSLEDLLTNSDFVTIHTPLNESTKNFIGEKELALMKPEARLINVARGGIVDEMALYRAVEEGRLAGAAVDVFAQEPATNNILLKSDKVIVTPHLGASTAEAQVAVALDVAREVLTVLQGLPPLYGVNTPWIPHECVVTQGPFCKVAIYVGRLAAQLADGHPETVFIKYEGDISQNDTTILKASLIAGLLEPVSLEKVNIVNFQQIAQKRGLRILEQKSPVCENYGSLITAELTYPEGFTRVAGTLVRQETHIVQVNSYWVDIVPTGGYWLFSDHLDRPGLISAVSGVTGRANVNIAFMQVSRQKARGPALMVLSLDEPLGEEQRREILAIPDVYTARVAKL